MVEFRVGDRVRYIPCKNDTDGAWQNMTIKRIKKGGYWADDDNTDWVDGYFPIDDPKLELIIPPNPTLTRRMEALIEQMAGAGDIAAMTKEARAIMAELKPVDSDLIEARKIAAKRWNGDGAGYGGPDLAKNIDNGECDDLWYFKPVYDAIKRGRELERGEA